MFKEKKEIKNITEVSNYVERLLNGVRPVGYMWMKDLVAVKFKALSHIANSGLSTEDQEAIAIAHDLSLDSLHNMQNDAVRTAVNFLDL